jgi:hypothetical protein
MPAGSTYTPIATTTISGTSTSEVQFSSIPSTYTDLVIIGNLGATTNSYPCARFNSDTAANYSVTDIYGNGTSAASARGTSRTIADISYDIIGNANVEMNFIANIMNYSNSTTYKTMISRVNLAANGATATVSLWRNTAAITNIKLYTATANGSNLYNFANGSTFTLYGIASA